MIKNTLFNPSDEHKIYKNLNTFIEKHTKNQIDEEKKYKLKPNDMCCRDKYGNLQVVSKYYYLYYLEDDDGYETLTELEDKEWYNYSNNVKLKYKS